MNTKQVIVFRKDLLKGPNAIRKGKFGAQVAHASLGALLKLFNISKKEPIRLGSYGDIEPGQIHYEYSVTFGENTVLDDWLNGKFTKVVVSVDSDEELIEIYKYIHFKNGEIEKELETAKEGTEYYDRLLDKLKDEDLFDDIPCVVEYINKKLRETA